MFEELLKDYIYLAISISFLVIAIFTLDVATFIIFLISVNNVDYLRNKLIKYITFSMLAGSVLYYAYKDKFKIFVSSVLFISFYLMTFQ